MSTGRNVKLAPIAAAALVTVAAACGSPPDSEPAAAGATCALGADANATPLLPAPPESVVKQAKAEGMLVWYDGANINLDQIDPAFQQRWGIKVQFQHESSSLLQARLPNEEKAGTHQADVINSSNAGPLVDAAGKAGYPRPLDEVMAAPGRADSSQAVLQALAAGEGRSPYPPTGSSWTSSSAGVLRSTSCSHPSSGRDGT